MHVLGLNRFLSSVVVLTPLAYIGFGVYGVRKGWGADQWGDLATWMAGIATTGAVLVALWQTKLAREVAEQARADAEREVARVNAQRIEELAAADDRLARELDAARRMEQVRTIPPIWPAVTAVSTAFVMSFKEGITRGPTEHTEEALAIWQAEYMEPFLAAVTDLELSFTPAVMLISEPHTQRLVTELYKKSREVNAIVAPMPRQRLQHGTVPDLAPLTSLLQEMREMRKSITNAVREHLIEVPPLDPDV
ncbi:hypothetical protein [Nocardia salmonicida]|uniref:hypothetical protein n=1 Tax=Nocardia salmonicida TaxID=53431 RepID=UPI003414E2E7